MAAKLREANLVCWAAFGPTDRRSQPFKQASHRAPALTDHSNATQNN